MRKDLKYALIFFLIAVLYFLYSMKREKEQRELVEDVHSTIDFGSPVEG